MIGFVLLSHPRSGTNNLIRILSQHPDVHCAGEIFNPRDEGYGYAIDLGLAPLAESRDLGLLGEFYNRARRRESKEIVGFKLFGYQLSDDALFRVVSCRALPKILLHRANLLKAYVSWAVATRTSQWKVRRNGTQERKLPEPFDVDLEQAAKWLDSQRHGVTWFRQVMKESDVPFIECTYETLFSLQTLQAVDRFLGVAPRTTFEHFFRIQSGQATYDRILNRSELENRFGKTFGTLADEPLQTAGRVSI